MSAIRRRRHCKGQIVREIDALGGQTGNCHGQKRHPVSHAQPPESPAMWSPCSQSDCHRFIEEWTSIVSNMDNLYIWQDTVNELINDIKQITGVRTPVGKCQMCGNSRHFFLRIKMEKCKIGKGEPAFMELPNS